MRVFKYFILDFLQFIKYLFSKDKKYIFVDKKTENERLNICKNCNLLEKSCLGDRCGICGCFLKYKTKFVFEECPSEDKKWR
jgi:hypothetical protein